MRETEKGFRLRDNEDYYSREEIENYNDQLTDDLMMPGTSINNKLANEEFVNSSITHMAANPRGNWPNWNSVPTDPTLYPADADGNKTPSNNDYMVVQDMTGYVNPEEPSRTYEGTWRFTYVGEWDDPIPGGTKGKTGWKPIYQVNEKPLTQAQVDALNSGINSTKVSNYDNHVGNTNNPHRVTKEQIGLQNVDNTSDRNKPVSDPQQTELDKKVDIAQGSQNEGKILGIDNEGNVVPVDPPQSGVTPEQLATKLDKTNEIHKIEIVTELPKARDLYTMYMVVEEEEEWPGLKLTANQNDSTIGYTINGTINKDIYYSTDGKSWNEWNGSDITLNDGEYIYVWNKINTLSTSFSNKLHFTMSGSIAASGNCNSMIDFGELTPYCYYSMFYNCTALVQAPDLPSTQLAECCYGNMFQLCNITTAPDLPATTLAYICYSEMFKACTALTTAPDLPATTLANGCYSGMFLSCTALTTALELPATTLNHGCYSNMFYGCTSLNSIKLHYTGNFDSNYFYEWTKDVSPTGTLYYNGSDTTRGDSAIPQNWAVEGF